MYMHDPFIWSRPGHQANARWGVADRRRLATIERDLMADEPVLSAKFAVFSQLAGGEQPVGAERIPGPAWSRTARVAALVLLLAIVASCVTLSAQLHSVTRLCPAAMSVRTSGHGAALHDVSCSAYPTAR